MQKLHLVGVTTDRDGLILSVRRGARSGSYVLAVDDDLVTAVDEHRQRQAEAAEGSVDDGAATPRAESTLSVREIQARLRRGRSVAEVASAAGVAEEWVERFAPPVLAERARVVAAARSSSLDRSRLGPSAVPLGDAVARHLADRGVTMTPEEQAERWTAHLLDGGRWAVRFTYRYRGKERVLAYELDEQGGSVAALDRTSGQMGYVTPSSPKPVRGGRPEAGSSSARREPSPTARERERATDAMRTVATRQAADAERAVARRAEDRAGRAARGRPAAPRDAATTSPTEPAAEKAVSAKKVPAKKVPAKKVPAKKVPAKKVPAKKVPAKKVPAKKVPAKKVPAKKVPAKKVPAKKVPAKKVPNDETTKRTGAPAPGAVRSEATTRMPGPPLVSAERPSPSTVAPSVARPAAPGSSVGPAADPVGADRSPERPSPSRRVVPPRTPLERARAREEPAPRFRFNLVEPAGPDEAEREPVEDRPRPPGVDGTRPGRRPPGRPARTRPLRAT